MIPYYLLYFSSAGWLTFAPRFYASLGCTDAQIGLLTSIPALIGMCVQPLWGVLSDRLPTKKLVLNLILAALTFASFWVGGSATPIMLMLSLTVFTVFQLPVSSLSTTIAIEHSRAAGKNYGVIRMMGTLGYQIGAVMAGYALKNDIARLYPYTGIVFGLTFLCSLRLPPVKGHQHGKPPISLWALLKDNQVVLLYLMVLLGGITSKFFFSFYTKYLGDLGIGSTQTGYITLLSAALEIPLLLWGDKLYRKASIWHWLLLTFVLNGVRWLGIACCKSVGAMLLFNLPAVTIPACFDFMACLWLNDHVPAELTGSAQAVLGFISLGLARVIGSLLGGLVCQAVGISAVFAFNGVLLLVAAAVFYFPLRRIMRRPVTQTLS